MLKYFMATVLLLLVAISLGCGSKAKEDQAVEKITAAQAKGIMDAGEPCIILDVRQPEEYAAGHIKGARLLPDNEITARAAQELPDKNVLLLVYCRSGRRSAGAAQTLARLGYTRVKDFGGIIDWPYEVEK